MNHEPRKWSLQEAKSKFSELVRRAQTEGPQLVTVHGKHAVVVSAASGDKIAGKYDPTGTGLDLLRTMQACPVLDFEIPERPHESAPLRTIEFG